MGRIHESVPPSVAAIVKFHNGIEWHGDDAPFIFNGIDENGLSNSLPQNLIVNDSGFVAEIARKNLEINAVVAPITNGQDWYIFNPLIESCGEPALCAVSHDDGLVKNPVTTQWNFKSTFLRLLASFVVNNVDWSRSVSEISKIHFELVCQIKRYVKKAIVLNDKLITIQTKIRAELIPYYPGAGNQIAIYNLKTGQELSSLMLELRPFDMVLHHDTLYIFCVSYGETGNRFLLNSYKISETQQLNFHKTLDEIIVSKADAVKCGTNDVADASSLSIHENALIFFFRGFKDLAFKAHEIRVYNLDNNEHRFTYTFPETFVRSVRQMDDKLFCEVDSGQISNLSISGETLKKEPWFDVDCRGIFCIINEFVYAQVGFAIAVYDKQGKQLFVYKNPDSYGIGHFYSVNNILLSDTGYFYTVLADGQLAAITPNVKSRLISEHFEKIGIDQRYMFLQRKFERVKFEKELLFEVYAMRIG